MNRGSPIRRCCAGIANIKLFSLKKPKSFVILELKSFIKYNIIKSKIVFITLLCLMLMLALISVCHAATINYPNDYPSLQNAINAANIGDTVLISKGTFNEPNEIILKDGVNIKGIGTIRSDSKITCSIRGASNCTVENLTLEPPDSSDYALIVPQASRNMKLKACYIYAYKPILIEGSGITFENNIINGDQSRFNLSLPLSLILLRNNSETGIYPNLIKNNTFSIKVENETSPDGYLLHLLNSGNTKITNNILDAAYDSPEGLKVLTTGRPLLIEGASTPSIEYNAYVGYIDEASLGKGNIAASALSERPLPNTTTSLPDASIAKEAGLIVTVEGSHAVELGAFGDAPDYVLPVITNITPVSGISTRNKRQSFHADISDNAGLKEARLRLDSGVWTSYPLLGKTGVVNHTPTIDMTDGTHYYYLLVYDLAGNVTTRTTRFAVDTQPPIVTNITPVSGTSTTNKRQSFHADVSDTALKEARLRLDSGAWIIYRLLGKAGVVNYTPAIDMLKGIHYYYLFVYDLAGNGTIKTTKFTVY